MWFPLSVLRFLKKLGRGRGDGQAWDREIGIVVVILYILLQNLALVVHLSSEAVPFLIFLLPSCPVCTTPSQCWWNMYAELRPRWKIQYPKGERGRTEVPRKIDDNNEFQICYLTMPSVRPVSTFFVAVSSFDIFVALIFSAYFYLTIARSLETRQHGTLQ